MRSHATIGTHPLHPILIAFPVAFTTGAFFCDLLGVTFGWKSVWTSGAYMSGAAVITGLLAGIPGFIDYLTVVPPRSSAKKRATMHMVINVTALLLYAVSFLFRETATLEPGVGTLILEGLGLGLVSWGGWLGGTLVYRNQIGVDHRYAEAGKWKEGHFRAEPGTEIEVANQDDLKVGHMKLLVVNTQRIVLVRTEEGHSACEDRCSHKGGSLAGGVSTCGRIICPWHGSTFDIKSGSVVAGPAKAAIRTFEVLEKAGKVYLRVPSS
jgi:nitrite reductase/ring-hydroxylating ferredoxin subunit/uncharacterized membrane protein